MRNNLLHLSSDGENCDLVLERAGIKPAERAENIGIEKLLALSDCLNEITKQEQKHA